jgi:hypothetical protein
MFMSTVEGAASSLPWNSVDAVSQGTMTLWPQREGNHGLVQAYVYIESGKDRGTDLIGNSLQD